MCTTYKPSAYHGLETYDIDKLSNISIICIFQIFLLVWLLVKTQNKFLIKKFKKVFEKSIICNYNEKSLQGFKIHNCVCF